MEVENQYFLSGLPLCCDCCILFYINFLIGIMCMFLRNPEEISSFLRQGLDFMVDIRYN